MKNTAMKIIKLLLIFTLVLVATIFANAQTKSPVTDGQTRLMLYQQQAGNLGTPLVDIPDGSLPDDAGQSDRTPDN